MSRWASAAAIDALKPLEAAASPGLDLLSSLAGAVTEADRALRAIASDDNRPVTTLIALLRHARNWPWCTSAIYLLRGGELSQLTQDHTWVQSQIDQGKLPVGGRRPPTKVFAGTGPGYGGAQVEADLALRTALAGDRYLLCSDGVSTVIESAALEATLTAIEDPKQAVARLVELAYVAGAPDNIACVVADVIEG